MSIALRAVLAYFALVNTVLLSFVAIAAIDVWRRKRRASFTGAMELANPAAAGISVVLPVREGSGTQIAETVRAMLALRYAVHEVVVVTDDGADEVFGALDDALSLVEIPRALTEDVHAGCTVRGVFVAANVDMPLVVVRTAHGTRTDLLNCGVNTARLPLVMVVAPDVVLDADALGVMAGPFIDDPRATLATVSAPRILNGCEVVAGRLAHVQLPAGWLGRIAVIDRLRSHLFGRVLAALGPTFVRDRNALAVYRRDVLVEIGGFRTSGRDASLDAMRRMTTHPSQRGQAHRVTVVPEPVAWAAVEPERQLAAPDVWVVRSLGLLHVVRPLVELLAVVLLVASLATSSISALFAVDLIVVAYVYAMFVGVCAVAVDEYAHHHFHEVSDFAAAGAACVLENAGGRQLFAWWQLRELLSRP